MSLKVPEPPPLRARRLDEEPWLRPLAWLGGGVLALGGLVWVGGQLAALLLGAHRRLPVGLADMPDVLVRLPGHLAQPARAWPRGARAFLPGALGYWAAFALVLLGAGALGLAAARVLPGVRSRAAWRRPDADGRGRSLVIAGGVNERRSLRRQRGAGGEARGPGGHAGPGLNARPGPPRWLLGLAGRRPLWCPEEGNVLVLGPARSGKSRGVVRPNLARWPGGLVVTSTRPEAYAWARAARADSGRSFCVFDPAGLLGAPESVAWWPWLGAERWDRAVTVADAMCASLDDAATTNSRHFAELAAELLAPLLHAGALAGAGLSEVRRWAVDGDVRPLIARLRELGAETASRDLAAFERQPEERSGKAATLATARRALRWAAREEVRAYLETRPPLDLARLVQEGGTLVVVSPSHRMAELAPLMSALLGSLVEVGQELAFASPGHRLSVPFGFLLDEVPAIAPFPGLPAHMATGGGFGMPSLAVGQDLAQLAARWGAEEAQTIWNNAACRIITRGAADERTEAAAARLGGQELVWRRTHGASRGRSQSGWGGPGGAQTGAQEGWQESWEPALRPGELAQIPLGYGLLLAGGLRPQLVGLVGER